MTYLVTGGWSHAVSNGFFETALRVAMIGVLIVLVMCIATLATNKTDSESQMSQRFASGRGGEESRLTSNPSSRDFANARSLDSRLPQNERIPDYRNREQQYGGNPGSTNSIAQRLKSIELRLGKTIESGTPNGLAEETNASTRRTLNDIGSRLTEQLSSMRVASEVELRDLSRQVERLTAHQDRLQTQLREQQGGFADQLQAERSEVRNQVAAVAADIRSVQTQMAALDGLREEIVALRPFLSAATKTARLPRETSTGSDSISRDNLVPPPRSMPDKIPQPEAPEPATASAPGSEPQVQPEAPESSTTRGDFDANIKLNRLAPESALPSPVAVPASVPVPEAAPSAEIETTPSGLINDVVNRDNSIELDSPKRAAERITRNGVRFWNAPAPTDQPQSGPLKGVDRKSKKIESGWSPTRRADTEKPAIRDDRKSADMRPLAKTNRTFAGLFPPNTASPTATSETEGLNIQPLVTPPAPSITSASESLRPPELSTFASNVPLDIPDVAITADSVMAVGAETFAPGSTFKVRATVLHLTADGLSDLSPAGIRSLSIDQTRDVSPEAFEAKHKQLVEEIRLQLKNAADVEDVTDGELSAKSDETARLRIGFQCLHCNEEQGLDGGDAIDFQFTSSESSRGRIELSAISAAGDVLSDSYPEMHHALADGSSFLISERGQKGAVDVQSGLQSPLSRIPLIGSRFTRQTKQQRAIQRIVVVSVLETPQHAPSLLPVSGKQSRTLTRTPDAPLELPNLFEGTTREIRLDEPQLPVTPFPGESPKSGFDTPPLPQPAAPSIDLPVPQEASTGLTTPTELKVSTVVQAAAFSEQVDESVKRRRLDQLSRLFEVSEANPRNKQSRSKSESPARTRSSLPLLEDVLKTKPAKSRTLPFSETASGRKGTSRSSIPSSRQAGGRLLPGRLAASTQAILH